MDCFGVGGGGKQPESPSSLERAARPVLTLPPTLTLLIRGTQGYKYAQGFEGFCSQAGEGGRRTLTESLAWMI